jgi:hypothetical protein
VNVSHRATHIKILCLIFLFRNLLFHYEFLHFNSTSSQLYDCHITIYKIELLVLWEHDVCPSKFRYNFKIKFKILYFLTIDFLLNL